MSQDQKIAELRDNAIAEVEYLEAQRVLRAMKGFPLTESLADNNFVDPYEYLRDQGQWSFIGPTNAAIGAGRPDMRGDRDHGRDWPLFQTETELGYFRAMGRAITNHIPAGINILESLTNYVVGTGMQFECRPVGEEGKELAERVQRVVDQFLDDNDFVGDLDRELHARSRKDGEFFVKVERVGWRTRLRVIEPACVTEPMDANTLCDALDCGGPCDWRFGIHTAANDTSRVYGYHVVYDGIGQDWEYLSADQCEHFKRNTDRNVKRGVSDFYPVDAWLKRTEKLLRNTTGGAAIQAAIAFIREHGASVSASSVETFRASKAWDTINRNTPAGFQSKSIQKFDEGTVLDVGQQKYSAGPMGAGEATAGYIAVLQAALRYVGIRWSMPEYLISGDASNANYASTKESGTPFVKAREADQAFYVSRFRRLAWKAVKNAVDGGALGGLTMEQITQLVDIHVAAPRVDSRDSINETTSDKTLVDAGAMSVRTMAIRAGLDYDREVSQGAKAAAPPDIGGMFGRSPQDNQQPDDWSDSQDDDGDTEDIEESYDESDHPRDENGQWTRHVGGASHGYTVAGKSVAHLTHKGGGKYSVMIQHPTEKKHKEIEISAESTKEAKELAVKIASDHRSKARESAANAAQKKEGQIAHHKKLEKKCLENIEKAKKNIADYQAMIARGHNVDVAKKVLAGQEEWLSLLQRDLKDIREFLTTARSEKGKQVAESVEWTDGNILESIDSSGHEHKGKGPGGGQFTSSDSGGGGASKDNSETNERKTHSEINPEMRKFLRSGWETAKKGGGSPFMKIRMNRGMFTINADIDYEPGEGYYSSGKYTVFQSNDGGLHGKTLPKKFNSVDDAANAAESRYKMMVDQGFAKKPEEGHELYELFKRASDKHNEGLPPIEIDKPRLPDGREIPKNHIACTKCGGYGHLGHFSHVSEGVCFKCGGSGLLKLSNVRESIEPDLFSAASDILWGAYP